MTERLVYTIPEAAEVLRYDRETVYDLIASGALVARRLRPRGHLRILGSDLQAFLASAAAVVATDAPDGPAPTPITAPRKSSRQRVVRRISIVSEAAE